MRPLKALGPPVGVWVLVTLLGLSCGILTDQPGQRADAGSADGGPAEDGGASDAGITDGGAGDGGASDAGAEDGGATFDGGGVDAGGGDGGPVDGGPFDGGPADGGTPDAGPVDGGAADGSAVDAGPGDGGPFDGGPGDLLARCPRMLPVGTVRIAATCPFAACGGDITGVWTYDDLCFTEDELFGDLGCSGLTVTNVSGRVQGCVVADQGAIAETYEYTVNATVHVPALCIGNACQALETALATLGIKASCRSAMRGGCRCEVALDAVGGGSDTYVTMGHRLILGDGTTYDYCVAGRTFTADEIAPNPDSGIRTLGR